MTGTVEVNFDGLVGPTHNYAGLSYGNLASERNVGTAASPRDAALEGLRKMKALHDLGLKQAVLPPQERPAVHVLRRLGFSGTDGQLLAAAARKAPRLLAACASASSMWAANAATVSPGADTADGRVHLTPANLVSKFHRAIEADTTARVLKAIFGDERFFAHHEPLPAVDVFGDEGAANHSRLCARHAAAGVELFVFGRSAPGAGPAPGRYPARQTREASEAVARLHRLAPERTVYARQNPEVIDRGVFHNDVIAVANENVIFHHEKAFAEPSRLRAELVEAYGSDRPPIQFLEVPQSRIGVDEAVSSYLFNSQLVTLPSGDMALIVPEECRTNPRVWAYLGELPRGDSPVRRIHVQDVKQSMRNGGGPACLRLRVVLTEPEAAAVAPGVWLDDARYEALRGWVTRHYRDRLGEADLADPALLAECRTALDELTQLLGLGSIYPYQRTPLGIQSTDGGHNA